MHCTTAISPRGVSAFVFTALCLVAAPASAQDDSQLWTSTNLALGVAPNVTALAETSYRFREGDDQFLTRATVEWQAIDGFSLSGGIAFTQTAKTSEYRPFQQVSFTTGPLALRTRLEERFFDGATRAQLRLRQRVQVGTALRAGTRAALSGEYFHILRSQNPGSTNRTEQWRINATVIQRVSPHVDMTGGYLYIRTPVPLGADRNSHVGQLTLTFRP